MLEIKVNQGELFMKADGKKFKLLAEMGVAVVNFIEETKLTPAERFAFIKTIIDKT